MSEKLVELGSDRWLFVDRALLESERGTAIRLHPPQRRETVWTPARPWEGNVCWFPHAVKDGDRYRMWYWARRVVEPGPPAKMEAFGAYMESQDGIHWERPHLGLVPFEGSTNNNLVWPPPGQEHQNLAVFIDESPASPPEERYKALLRGDAPERGLWGAISPDGLRWTLLGDRPMVPSPADDWLFDSPNVAFWDPWREEYAIYARGWTQFQDPPPAVNGVRQGDYKTRRVRRTASKDFQNWSEFEYLDLHQVEEPREQLYTNATVAYERSRNLYFMFPMRFVYERKRADVWPQDGLSDIAFLSSRDGVTWDRLFPEAWIRPGLDQNNWHDRSMAVGRGIVQTGADELSLYVNEAFRTPAARFVRYTVRLDGFGSINAPLAGGEVTTVPLTFAGDTLELNYATSALGSVRVEIQNESGAALPGYALEDCDPLFGDDVARRVTWRGQASVAALIRQPVRLRVALHDADVYSLVFALAAGSVLTTAPRSN
jgi:hypothetical protein